MLFKVSRAGRFAGQQLVAATIRAVLAVVSAQAIHAIATAAKERQIGHWSGDQDWVRAVDDAFRASRYH